MEEKKTEHSDDRREFLKTAGKLAVTIPPAMTVLLTTTLNSTAIAASGSTTPKPGGPPPISPF